MEIAWLWLFMMWQHTTYHPEKADAFMFWVAVSLVFIIIVAYGLTKLPDFWELYKKVKSKKG